MNSFMSVDKGLPKNDDRALYLNVKLYIYCLSLALLFFLSALFMVLAFGLA